MIGMVELAECSRCERLKSTPSLETSRGRHPGRVLPAAKPVKRREPLAPSAGYTRPVDVFGWLERRFPRTMHRVAWVVSAVDLLFTALILPASILVFDFHRGALAVVLRVVAPLLLAKAIWLVVLVRRLLLPVDLWERAAIPRGTRSRDEVEAVARAPAAARAAWRMPIAFPVAWPLTWVFLFAIAAAILELGFPGRVPLGPHPLPVAALFCGGLLGAGPLAHGLASALLGPTLGRISFDLGRTSPEPAGGSFPLRFRLGLVAISLSLTPLAWMGSLTYAVVDRARVLGRPPPGIVGAFAVFLLAVLVWAPLTAWLVTETLSRPVLQIAAGVARLDRSNSEGKVLHVPIPTRDEIGALAQGVNDLSDRLAAARLRADHDLREIRLKTQQAEEAVRVREQFLTIAAHELRNPLTALGLSLQRIQRSSGQPAPPADAALANALRQLDRLRALVGELVDATRVAEGKLPLRLEPVDLRAVARAAIADCRLSHPQAMLRLEEGAGGAVVQGDPARIEELVVDLLDNAVTYSPADREVRLTIAGGDATVSLTVADQGIGIPAGDVERIFDRFYHAATASPLHYGGLGLGLYICRDIARRHGGRIWAESQVGHGSVFHLEIPVGGPAAPAR